jgi:hypothetical protein
MKIEKIEHFLDGTANISNINHTGMSVLEETSWRQGGSIERLRSYKQENIDGIFRNLVEILGEVKYVKVNSDFSHEIIRHPPQIISQNTVVIEAVTTKFEKYKSFVDFSSLNQQQLQQITNNRPVAVGYSEYSPDFKIYYGFVCLFDKAVNMQWKTPIQGVFITNVIQKGNFIYVLSVLNKGFTEFLITKLNLNGAEIDSYNFKALDAQMTLFNNKIIVLYFDKINFTNWQKEVYKKNNQIIGPTSLMKIE